MPLRNYCCVYLNHSCRFRALRRWLLIYVYMIFYNLLMTRIGLRWNNPGLTPPSVLQINWYSLSSLIISCQSSVTKWGSCFMPDVYIGIWSLHTCFTCSGFIIISNPTGLVLIAFLITFGLFHTILHCIISSVSMLKKLYFYIRETLNLPPIIHC